MSKTCRLNCMNISPKKIAFFGTPPFTVRFLELLDTEGFTPSLIITNPDRRAGRGLALVSPEPKHFGIERNIPVLQPERIDEDFVQKMKAEEWDLFIVIAYGSILPENLITVPRFGTLNVHYSLLPKYRGATPVESAILNGDSVTGVSIQQMRYKLDSGPILAAKDVAIADTDTTPVLREKLNDQALLLLPGVIRDLFEGKTTALEQDETLATQCGKIKKKDGLLLLTDDDQKNFRKYRAYVGSVGTYFMITRNGTDIRVKIKSAHMDNGRFVIDTVIPENGKLMKFDALVSKSS
jgi:methionyl-tRNA formyltransferase